MEQVAKEKVGRAVNHQSTPKHACMGLSHGKQVATTSIADYTRESFGAALRQ